MQVGGSDTADQLAGAARFFERREEKYEVDRATARLLQGEIACRLPLFSYQPGHPWTYVTTIYFDTKNRDFYHRAELHYDDNVKIRVKEYYYPTEIPLKASGKENGESEQRTVWVGEDDPPRAGRTYQTMKHCFVELKQRSRGTVIKKRFAFPKADLGLLFNGQDIWPLLAKVTHPSEMGPLREIYHELQHYIARYPVEVTSIVNYRRTVYQKDENDLRVTLDDRLAVFPPLPGLYTQNDALTAEVLGRPIRTSERVILEIKCPGQYPEWLRSALKAHSSERLSKFTTSVRLLLGRHGAEPQRRGACGGPCS